MSAWIKDISNTHWRETTLVAIVVVAVSTCWGLAFGLNYGESNQNTYLLRALHMFDSNLLAHDWLTTETTDYHPFFSYLAWLLYLLSPAGWAFGIINVITYILAGIILYGIISETARPTYRLPIFSLLIGVLTLTNTYSISGSFIFSWYFQPSTIGGLGCLAALLFFLKGRYLTSSIVIATTGLFHANYLVLAFPLFFIAHLFIGRQQLVTRLIKQLGIPCLAMFLLLPLILKAAGSPGADQARMIFLTAMKPHHYVPLFFWKEYIPFVGWILFGFFGFTVAWNVFPCDEKKHDFRALLISLLFLMGISTLMTTVVYIPTVAQLYVWRLAPFQDLLFQMMACAGLVHLLLMTDSKVIVSKPALLSMVAGTAFVSAFLVRHGTYRFTILVVVAVILVVVTRRLAASRLWSTDRFRGFTLAFCLCFCVVAVFGPLIHISARSSLISGLRKSENELYQWARQTPIDSNFLIPPELKNFRVHAQRAIVADLKSPPILPDEFLKWYQRIKLISGIDSIATEDQIIVGYTRMDSARLLSLLKEYGIDYVVLKKGVHYDFAHMYELCFENERFNVLRLDYAISGQPG